MERYPIGKQDFKSLREGGFTYVDKTSFIIKLLEGAGFYFLARPRRFGKSLFLSTLDYFFKGEKKLFEGLAIEKYNWEWNEFPVIHLDFGISGYSSPEFLYDTLNTSLEKYETLYEVSILEKNNLTDRFRRIIEAAYIKTGLKVVVLVDEYEKPVIDNIENPDILEKNRSFLRGFYSVLKSLDKYLQMVFMTGVTKFGQMSVFSGLNNIRDISLNPDFTAICGITYEELVLYFKDGINNLAKEEEINFEDSLKLLKENYDGYHFSKDLTDIYNPYSIINALADRTIKAYWASTGTPSLLVDMIKEKNINIEKIEGVQVTDNKLLGINHQLDDPITLLFQSGYLTIKNYDKTGKTYTLDYPNLEVEQAFFDYLLPNFSGINIVLTESFIERFNLSLKSGDPYKAMATLEEFTAGISYDVMPSIETEKHFQFLVYIISKLILPRRSHVKVEDKTSDGRIDLLIMTSKFVYIIEIKKDKSAEKALNQIKEKEYALQFRNDTRKIFLIGMNFSTKKKRIEGFKIEEVIEKR
ncbi:MAG: AAA family ATPase [Muribaculaceae bacterium]|nr:AAA family ATPase [Muribaculaceae bacterium]